MEVKAEVKAETRVEVKVETKAVVKVEAKVEVKAEAKAAADLPETLAAKAVAIRAVAVVIHNRTILPLRAAATAAIRRTAILLPRTAAVLRHLPAPRRVVSRVIPR